MLPSSGVSSLTQFSPAAYSVIAVFLWGSADFAGGYGSRRANAFVLTAFSHVCAFALMFIIALSQHGVFLPAPASFGRCWRARSEDFPCPSSIALWPPDEWESPRRSPPWWAR